MPKHNYTAQTPDRKLGHGTEKPGKASTAPTHAKDKFRRYAGNQQIQRLADNLPTPSASSHRTGNSAPSPRIPSQLHTLEQGGNPLPARQRAPLEARFGQDFSAVRIHTDDAAARMASLLNARAFTLGPHIVFGAEQYAPDTEQGRKLVTHELAHTVQQARIRSYAATGVASLGGAAEREADAVARGALNPRQLARSENGNAAATVARVPLPLLRQWWEEVGESIRAAAVAYETGPSPTEYQRTISWHWPTPTPIPYLLALGNAELTARDVVNDLDFPLVWQDDGNQVIRYIGLIRSILAAGLGGGHMGGLFQEVNRAAVPEHIFGEGETQRGLRERWSVEVLTHIQQGQQQLREAAGFQQEIAPMSLGVEREGARTAQQNLRFAYERAQAFRDTGNLSDETRARIFHVMRVLEQLQAVINTVTERGALPQTEVRGYFMDLGVYWGRIYRGLGGRAENPPLGGQQPGGTQTP